MSWPEFMSSIPATKETAEKSQEKDNNQWDKKPEYTPNPPTLAEYPPKTIKDETDKLPPEMSAQISPYKEFTKGDFEKWKPVEIDYKWNNWAQLDVPNADIIPKSVKSITVEYTDKDWKIQKVEWIRQWNWGSFYTKDWEYIPLQSWYKVTPTEMFTDEQIQKSHEEKLAKTQELLSSDYSKEFVQKYWEDKAKVLIEKALDYWIDPNLLMSLKQSEFSKSQDTFWFTRFNDNGFDLNASETCRSIQNNMNRYRSLSWQSPTDDQWKATPDFLSFMANTMAPLWNVADQSNPVVQMFSNLLNSYGKTTWKSYSSQDVWNILSSGAWLRDAVSSGAEIKWKTSPDQIISSAEKYLGMKYQMWWSWNWTIDCSQLVVNAMKEWGVVWNNYDNTAAWLNQLTTQKSPQQVERWDLVFINKWNGISHVEIAKWPAVNWSIPIIDAAWWKIRQVTNRNQPINNTVSVWKPSFYA